MNFSYFVDEELALEPLFINLLSLHSKKISSIIQNFSLFDSLKLKGRNIFVYIVTTSVIKDLKYRFWGVHEETDVLTFPYAEIKFIEELDEIKFDEEINNLPDGVPFSEIYISLEVARQQSLEMKHTLEKELIILFVHALLHTLGFDHERTKSEAFKMKNYESKILQSLGLDVLPLTVIE